MRYRRYTSDSIIPSQSRSARRLLTKGIRFHGAPSGGLAISQTSMQRHEMSEGRPVWTSSSEGQEPQFMLISAPLTASRPMQHCSRSRQTIHRRRLVHCLTSSLLLPWRFAFTTTNLQPLLMMSHDLSQSLQVNGQQWSTTAGKRRDSQLQGRQQ